MVHIGPVEVLVDQAVAVHIVLGPVDQVVVRIGLEGGKAAALDLGLVRVDQVVVARIALVLDLARVDRAVVAGTDLEEHRLVGQVEELGLEEGKAEELDLVAVVEEVGAVACRLDCLEADDHTRAVHRVEFRAEVRTLVGLELDREAVGTDRAVEVRIGLEEVLVGQVEARTGLEELLVGQAVVARIELELARRVGVRIELDLGPVEEARIGLADNNFGLEDPRLVELQYRCFEAVPAGTKSGVAGTGSGHAEAGIARVPRTVTGQN